MGNTLTEDIEAMQTLRREWAEVIRKGIEIRDTKGYIDTECRARADKMEADLAKMHTDIGARVADLEKSKAAMMERLSRPPGAGGNSVTLATPSMMKMFTESEAFKSAQFNGKFNISATLNIRAIRPEQSKAVGPIVEGGIIGMTPPAGSYPIFPVRVGLIPQVFPKILMRDIVPVQPLDGTNAVEYVRETWTLGADYQVTEGTRKAQSGVTYTQYIAPVRTIAHFVKVSRQMAADVPFIMGTIEQKLGLGIALKEDKEILFGDGSTGHLQGIMPLATPAATYMPATPPTTANSMDQLNVAATYIENTYFYFPTAIIMNPVDESKLEMLKTSFGSYVLQDRSPYVDGVPRLWGLPIYTTPVMTQGNFLLGQFPGNSALFDRETTTVEIAFQNEDDFVNNLVTIRAEERVALAWFVPQAFACGPFTVPPGNTAGPMFSPEEHLQQKHEGEKPAVKK